MMMMRMLNKGVLIVAVALFAVAASLDDMAVTATSTIKRRLKSSKNAPPSPPKEYYSYAKKKVPPKKNSKKNPPTPMPVPPPTPAPILIPPKPTKFRWASSGGGWRSMVGDMGFANVFAQAGLITKESSVFSSVSTVSGSSWFSTQFFYSPQFFTNVTTSSPDQLGYFVLQWMESYNSFLNQIEIKPQCDAIFDSSDSPVFAFLEAFCKLVAYYGGDWASFVQGMIGAASFNYGDEGLYERTVGRSNRVDAMSDTDLYIQMALAPNSRTRSVPNGAGIYLGPNHTNDRDNSNDGAIDVYSVPMCVQYSVTQHGTKYYSTDIDDGGTSLDYSIFLDEQVSTQLDYPRGYKEFGLYPVPDFDVVFDPLIDNLMSTKSTLTTPFKGQVPSVTMVASASSAFQGLYSPLNPSVYSQAFSKPRYAVNESKQLEFDKVVDQLYDNTVFDKQSVCSQWPDDCGKTDGQFIDGYYTDQCSLALNIGQYQTQNNDDTTSEGEEPLKVILTDTNLWYEDATVTILPYFNSPVNEGITPGEYMWPDKFALPLMSPQIFDLKMDLDSLAGITTPIPGINVTVAKVLTTTLDNPRFHVKAGQLVDILILRLNSNIPTLIVGTEAIQATKTPLAEMAKGIASSKELLNEIKGFMNFPTTSNPTFKPSAFPTGSPTDC